MNGPDHYREAERRLLMAREDDRDPSDSAHLVAEAQVHATLALAAATALLGPHAANIEGFDTFDLWRKVAGSQPEPVAQPGQVDPEPAAPVRIDSLIQRVADGEQIAVSHPGWNDGKPVDLVELHPRFAGDTEVRYGVRGVFALINATVPADFLVTPVGGA